ncbi:MAG: RNA 2',3'-cyclic phosphodiesterase [Candidatus Aegiribacteria sp.]|nr:RNA 2',3'-cyclic phosphodiesterase [Candidatus Aegiribacteria sp.]
MRIFVALELPEHIIKEIQGWQEQLMSLHPSLKWVKPEHMHLTLRFFGDIKRKRMLEVERLLSSRRTSPLEFTLDKLGTFCGKDQLPFVYWLGGTFPSAISHIAEELGKIPDDRGRINIKKYLPHITIARRRMSSTSPRLPEPPVLQGRFHEAVIFNSRLTPAGPEYSRLKSFEFHSSRKVIQ